MKNIIALLSAVSVILPPAANAASTAYSPSFTVDTRTGNLTVTGRVLDKEANLPLAGAGVSLAGVNSSSGTDGKFSFKVDLGGGSTLTASKTGYLSQTRTVTAATGLKSVSVGDIALVAATDKPVVEWVKPDTDGIFIAGFGLVPTLRARVNWNGKTPSQVTFQLNGRTLATRTGSGPEYTASVSVDSDLSTSSNPAANEISVTAVPQTGSASEPFNLALAVVPVPAGLRAVVNSGLYQAFGPDHVGFDFELSSYEQKVNLWLIGTFGFEWGANAAFDYTISDGAWEAAVGFAAEGKQGKRGRRPNFPGLTRYPKAKLYIGNKEISGYINGKAAGTATRSNGIVLSEYSIDAGLSTRLELTRYSFLDIFGPGITNAFSLIPPVGKVLKNASVIVEAVPSLEGTGTVLVSPYGFKDASLTGKLALEGTWPPEIWGVVKGRVYLGADATLGFGYPEPIFRGIVFRLYAGYELTAFGVLGKAFEITASDEIAKQLYPPDRRLLVEQQGTPDGLVEAAGNNAGWQPIPRPWRDTGGEQFLLVPTGPDRRLAESTELDAFTRMGVAPSPGAVFVPGAGPGRRIASDPALPAQAELPLLSNVFPESEPALAGSGSNLMLLYVRDTGAANPIQFTEVGWSFFNGTSWTTPAAVAADARGQFEPALAFDGTGAAVAVWTRIKDAGFSGTELDELAAQMEIVSAKWDPGTQTWGAVTTLTDNAFLDHKPRLAGPLTDGDLILTWRENQANLLIGTGDPGAAENTRIMTRRWDATAGTWGAAEVLIPDLANEMSDSLAALGGKAVLAITRDMDGDLDDFSDCELFYRVFDAGTGTWGALTRHTTDAVHDRNARVALDSSGNIYCVWQRGDDLVMDKNFSGTQTQVRPDSATLGFSDFALTVGPGGNVVAVWQEMNEFGSDAHYRVFDPASNTWGLDTLLSQDSDLEHSFSLVWDPMANLVLAYNNVTITKETMTVELEGGGTIDVPGVPQPGQVDLLLAKRALVKDLTIATDSLTAEGMDFLPGDSITFKATVLNSGNVAEENVQVGFYDGDPDAGGTLIETVTVPGWLKASGEADVTATWTVPEPAIARTVYVKVDPANAVTEFSETNNTQSLGLNGVDLDLQYVSGSVLRDGSVRAVVRIKNLGAPESPVSTLALKLAGGTDPLAEVSVSQLDPGSLVEIPVDLPAGSHPEGERSYRLVLDEDAASGDIDTDNNEVFFSLNLWIDDDGDGIPRSYEEANGMSDSDPTDALLDVDGDGFNAKQEYLAGTDPRDASSVLKPGEFNVVTNADGTTCTLSWASVAGRLYRVERSFDLKAWEPAFDDVPATPPLNSVEETISPQPSKVFYRITAK
jgi:hypothetical protein